MSVQIVNFLASQCHRVYRQFMPDIALYEPDIAGNTGTILRTAACLGFHVHIIEPTGFDVSDRSLKRAGMDYLEMAALTRHADWAAFQNWYQSESKALILLTTKTDRNYLDHQFRNDEVWLFGSESKGVPQSVHDSAEHRLTIKMAQGARSLNLAVSVGIIAAEGLRQITKSGR